MGQPELGVDLRGDSTIELRIADLSLARACAASDPRFAAVGIDLRVSLFEACVRLATSATAGPWPYDRLLDTTRQLAASEIGISWAGAELRLFPVDFDANAASSRMTRI